MATTDKGNRAGTRQAILYRVDPLWDDTTNPDPAKKGTMRLIPAHAPHFWENIDQINTACKFVESDYYRANLYAYGFRCDILPEITRKALKEKMADIKETMKDQVTKFRAALKALVARKDRRSPIDADIKVKNGVTSMTIPRNEFEVMLTFVSETRDSEKLTTKSEKERVLEFTVGEDMWASSVSQTKLLDDIIISEDLYLRTNLYEMDVATELFAVMKKLLEIDAVKSLLGQVPIVTPILQTVLASAESKNYNDLVWDQPYCLSVEHEGAAILRNGIYAILQDPYTDMPTDTSLPNEVFMKKDGTSKIWADASTRHELDTNYFVFTVSLKSFTPPTK